MMMMMRGEERMVVVWGIDLSFSFFIFRPLPFDINRCDPSLPLVFSGVVFLLLSILCKEESNNGVREREKWPMITRGDERAELSV